MDRNNEKLTVDDLKRILGLGEDQELASHFGVTKQAVNQWRNKGVPSRILLQVHTTHRAPVAISGGTNHIDVHHASVVSEPAAPYSPDVQYLCHLVSSLTPAQIRELIARAIEASKEDRNGPENDHH